MIKKLAFLLLPVALMGATTNELGKVVLINDAGETYPVNSIATPALVNSANAAASTTLEATEAVAGPATNAQAIAQAAYDRTTLYSTNYVVTSTVYVQSIGGVPYDPSNQTIRVHSVSIVSTNVVIIGTVKQVPLVTPVLDWRQKINLGAWSNITATVVQVDLPAGVTNAVRAYSFTVPKPSNVSAFFRVVDNSTGASGSGLYWLVFGGIYVDGRKGATTTLTNVVNNVTNTWPVVGGIVVDPIPM